jgi:hypothetical protein
MRTTLEIDDDVLAAARHLAREEGATVGQVISRLALQSLRAKATVKVRNGVRLFAPKAGGSRPDLSVVNRLRDDD